MMKIKEFIDDLAEIEKSNEQKAHKKNQKTPRSTKMPKSFFEYPIYQELRDVIISKKSTQIIPRRWDELTIDFKNSSVRTFSLCDEKVYKVSNAYNYNEIKNKNVFIAVPLNGVLFKDIYNEFKEQIDIFIFVQISRRLLQKSGYDESQDIYSCDTRKVIQSILSFLINRDWINYQSWIAAYQKFDLALDELLFDMVRYFKDEELLHLIARLKTL